MNLLIDMAIAADNYLIQMRALGFTQEESVTIYESLVREDIQENPDRARDYKATMKEIITAAIQGVCLLDYV